MVAEDGQLPLPWLEGALTDALRHQRGHAQMLHAAPGVGALEFALCLAQSRLCEMPRETGLACGRCSSCRLVRAHGHPDLFVVLPEALRREHEWPLPDDKPGGDEAKKKPSRQIRIDDVRAMLDWVTKTSALGRGKAALLHPAEALNHHAASALLKTVEEPPEGTRVLLTCTDPQNILPTVRSRCQQLALPPPPPELAARWLAAQGVAEPLVLLAACGGRPMEVLQWTALGVDSRAWAALPRAAAAGRSAAFAGWPVPLALQAMFKLCHDAMAQTVGGTPRFFAADTLPGGAALPALVAWSKSLRILARAAEHPWHEALSIDALVAGARTALSASTSHPEARHLDTLPG